MTLISSLTPQKNLVKFYLKFIPLKYRIVVLVIVPLFWLDVKHNVLGLDLHYVNIYIHIYTDIDLAVYIHIYRLHFYNVE